LGGHHFQSCCDVVIIVTMLWAGWSGILECWQEQEVHVFSELPTPAVVPTKPLVQWVAKLSGYEADPPSSSTMVKNEWNCTFIPPVCSHGACREMFTFFIFG